MKRLTINPFWYNAALAASATGTSKSIYLPTVDSSTKVTATLTTTGDFYGGSLAVKFRDSADDSTYADVTDGDFAAQTSATSETITFTLGSNVQQNTGAANYGKFIYVAYTVTGGDSGGTTAIAATVTLSGIGIPEDAITLKLYYKA